MGKNKKNNNNTEGHSWATILASQACFACFAWQTKQVEGWEAHGGRETLEGLKRKRHFI